MWSGNASTLSDGAAATVLMTEEALKKYGGTPLARIIGKIYEKISDLNKISSKKLRIN